MIPLNRPPSRNFLARLATYEEANITGGSLHIFLDDGNVEDHHIRFCRDWAREHNDPEGAWLAVQTLYLSKTQRRKIRHGGYKRMIAHQDDSWFRV